MAGTVQDSMPVSAVVLAAGCSSRMNDAHKLLLPWDQTTIIDHLIHLLVRACLSEIVVVLGNRGDSIRNAIRNQTVKFAYNPEYASKGLSSSIRRGVETAASHARGLLIVLGDMPEISSETIERLVQVFTKANSNAAICVPTYYGKPGNPVLFGAGYRTELTALSGDRGARSLIAKYPERILSVAVADPGIHIDIDTQADYGLRTAGYSSAETGACPSRSQRSEIRVPRCSPARKGGDEAPASPH